MKSNGKYKIIRHKSAGKDYEKIKSAGLEKAIKKLIAILEDDPFALPYENLKGYLKGLCSRRINKQHRLVYEVDKKEKIVKIMRMWTHYE